MNVVVLDSKHWPSVHEHGVEKQEIFDVVSSAVQEVEKLIPFIPDYVNFVAYPAEPEEVIPETGAMGMTYSDEYASAYFDYNVPYGKEKLLSEMRGTVFHELVHATTFHYEPWKPGVLFGVTTEGLATVFERDYAKAQPLWGEYEDDTTMREWFNELKKLPDTKEKNRDYFFTHPDGRKWIVYKTGVWVVDTLLKSGEDLFELMKLNHKDVIAKLEAL